MSRRTPMFKDPAYRLTVYAPTSPGAAGRDGGWRYSFTPRLPAGGWGTRRQGTFYGNADEVRRAVKRLVADLDARRTTSWRAITFRELCDRYLADERHDWSDSTRRSQVYKTEKLCRTGELRHQPLGELIASQRPFVEALERIADTPSDRRPFLHHTQDSLKLFRDHLGTLMRWAQKAHVELVPREYAPCKDLPTPETRRVERQPTVADFAGEGSDSPAVPVPAAAFLGTEDADGEDDGDVRLVTAADMPSLVLAETLGEMWSECSPGRPWYRRLSVDLAATAGLRWGEQHALTPRDVRLQEGQYVIRVARKLQIGANGAVVGTSLPKMGKRRVALAPSHLVDDLLKRCREVERAHGPDGLLFPSPLDPTRPYTQDSFSSTVRRYAPRCGWPVDQHGRLMWTWHSLRHLACVWQLRDVGIDPAMVSKGMGHGSVTFTLRRYVGTTADSWDIAAQQMRRWESERATDANDGT